MDIKEYYQIPPYSLDKYQRFKLLNKFLFKLTSYHYDTCNEYKKILIHKDLK